MRIAFVSTILSYPWGGADTLWTHAAESASERGDELFISVSPSVADSPRVSALRARGAAVFLRRPAATSATLFRRMAGKAGRFFRKSDGLIAALSRFRPELAIFSLGGTYDLILHPGWAAWLRASRTKFRLIANRQDENPKCSEFERARARELLSSADRVYFVSTRNLEATRRHLLHPLPNASVLQNPLRWRDGDAAPWPPEPPWNLATVSRLDEDKGIQLLLHAAARALSSEPDWRVNIYGQGPAESRLKAVIAHLGIGTRVRFSGYVRNLRAIWAENHLMVSPAIEDGVPMTIPEAMLCKRPVLATAVGGAEDWLADGETGFLCPAPTFPLLCEALRHAWQRRGDWRAMGLAAAAVASKRYRPDDYLRLLEP